MTKTQDIITKFNQSIIPAFSRKKSLNGVFDSPEDLDENQRWKNDDVLEILRQTLNDVEKSDFKSVQHLFIPPVITLIQDHEVNYKIMGIELLRIVIVKSHNLKDSGLTKLFLKDLSSCLTYHSNPELVQVSLDLMLDFICIQQSAEELEFLLNEGVLRGLVYSLGVADNVQNIFLQSLLRIVPELGAFSIQFTKSLIVSISDVLMVSTSFETIRIALCVLNIVIEYCWIRIPKYKGIILSSIAESWRISDDAEKNLEFYQQALVLLQECCGKDMLKDDLELLHRMKVYNILLGSLK